MGEAGWPALVVVLAVVLMVVGGISGWDMTPGDAFIAALVLAGAAWVVWQIIDRVRDRMHNRRRARRA